MTLLDIFLQHPGHQTHFFVLFFSTFTRSTPTFKYAPSWIYAPDRQTHYVTTLEPIAKTLFDQSPHHLKKKKSKKSHHTISKRKK